MKSLLKYLGLILIIVGTLILAVCYFTGDVNNNVVLGSTLALIVVGLITYILINKKITD